jgi:hypothetical protein
LQHFGWARQFGLCHYWVSRPLLCAARRGWVGETDGRFLALSTPAVAAAVGPHLMHVLTQQPNDRQLAALDLVINFIWVVSLTLKIYSHALFSPQKCPN